MIVEHHVATRHEHDEVDNIEVLCMGEWAKFERKRTCHWIGLEEWKNPVECSECGVLVVAHVALDSNYCCNCGAKVVEK